MEQEDLKLMVNSTLSNVIKFTLNEEIGKPSIPMRAYGGDAGWDLYTSRPVVIPPHTFKDVHVDVSVALPQGLWAMIVGRSSTIRKHGLRVETAIIDNGYRGELFVGVWNLSDNAVEINEGVRLAQFIPFELINMKWEYTEGPLPPSERGVKSFGSSGE